MRKTSAPILFMTVALAGFGVAGMSLAAKPTVVRAGNLVLELNGDVAPKRLPKKRLAPIALRISAGISNVDGSHPPAAKMVIADFDKHGTINARGLATCRSGQLQARSTTAAKAACRSAIVGSGKTTVEVAFPEQAPFLSTGPLVLFNGGVKRGVTTMYIHAYVDVPAPTAIVTTVKVKRIHKGRFGTRAIARIPKIAGGSGSVLRFSMKIKRTFTYKGKRRSYLLARCANGRFFAHGDIAFTGGPRVSGTLVRACQGRG
ncbi:MAG: hypothetical protein ACRDLL_05110 [Solirubrobacterales bacterium]